MVGIFFPYYQHLGSRRQLCHHSETRWLRNALSFSHGWEAMVLDMAMPMLTTHIHLGLPTQNHNF